MSAKLSTAGGAFLFVLCIFVYIDRSTGDPPEWCLVFEDDFSGDAVNTTTWLQEAGERTMIYSGRWPVSNEVRNGNLHLVTKKFESAEHVPRPKEAVFVPTRRWTTGHIWTKHLAFKRGYFEARLKIGNVTGLNNAFWLSDDTQPLSKPYKRPMYGPRGNFEIDILEGHYKDYRAGLSSIHFVLHDRHRKRKRWGTGRQFPVDKDLANHFHTYSIWWRLDDRIVFYVDGKTYWSVHAKDMYKGEKMRVHLSTSVHRWAGKIDWGHIEGSEMVVDYVKVWQVCSTASRHEKPSLNEANGRHD